METEIKDEVFAYKFSSTATPEWKEFNRLTIKINKK